MLSGNEVAQWFIFHNPELSSGYIDENTKINKLVYFSNLMYHCVYGKNLISDEFVAFPNGPVVFSVYRDYRYNGLNEFPKSVVTLNEEQEKVLNIINFIYGENSVQALVEESHTHTLWRQVKHRIPNNPKINFENIEKELVEYNQKLYRTYSDLEFSKFKKEKINGNVYYYMKDSLTMTDEIVEKLMLLAKYDEPHFLEIIDGELVIS